MRTLLIAPFMLIAATFMSLDSASAYTCAQWKNNCDNRAAAGLKHGDCSQMNKCMATCTWIGSSEISAYQQLKADPPCGSANAIPASEKKRR